MVLRLFQQQAILTIQCATYIYLAIGDDEIGSDEDCLVDVPNAVTADADATDTTGGYQRGNYATLNPLSSQGGTHVKWKPCLHTGLITTLQLLHNRTTGKWYWEVLRLALLIMSTILGLVGVASDTQDSGTFTKKVQFYSQASQSAIYRNSDSAIETCQRNLIWRMAMCCICRRS